MSYSSVAAISAMICLSGCAVYTSPQEAVVRAQPSPVVVQTQAPQPSSAVIVSPRPY